MVQLGGWDSAFLMNLRSSCQLPGAQRGEGTLPSSFTWLLAGLGSSLCESLQWQPKCPHDMAADFPLPKLPHDDG